MATENTGVAKRHPLYDKFCPVMETVDDFCDGEVAVKSKTVKYLPKLPSQYKNADPRTGETLYDIFLQKASLFPGARKTITAFKGILSRKPPVIVLPDSMTDYKTVFTLEGEDIITSSLTTGENVMKNYVAAYLVDIPTDGERSYAIPYTAKNIINWKYTVYPGGRKLTHVSLNIIDDGEEYIIHLNLEETDSGEIYTVTRYKQVNDEREGKKWEEVSYNTPLMKNEPLDFIPFVPISTQGLIMNLDYPMISEVAYLNKTHYQNDAEYRNALTYAGRPTACVSGLIQPENGHEVVMGTQQVWQFEKEGWAKFLGLDDASGIEAIKEAGIDLKNDMAIAGARILMQDPRQAEAAETAAIHRQGEHGQLSSVAIAVSKGITKVLQIMAKWDLEEEVQADEISFTMSMDFNPLKLDPQLLTSLWNMYVRGDISYNTLWYNMTRGELTEPLKTVEDEQKDIEEDMEKRTTSPFDVSGENDI